MEKFSKNSKLNAALNGIESQILNVLSLNEIARYAAEFPKEPDYNIAQYGSILVYYNDIREFYKGCGYKMATTVSDSRLWEIYKRQTGYVVRHILKNFKKR